MKLTTTDLVFCCVAIAFFIASFVFTFNDDYSTGLLMIPIGCFFLILGTTGLNYKPPDKDKSKK